MHRKDVPNPHAQAVWTRLVRSTERVRASIEAALETAALPPLSWYDVLWEIEKAGDEGIRPYELQDRLLLPQYGASRLLLRMEKAGLVVREPAPADGRGLILTLTAEGHGVRARMWPVYEAAMQETIGETFAKGEAARLAELLGKLV